MKLPRQRDVTFNTIWSAIIAPLWSEDIKDWLFFTLFFSICYTGVDYFFGKWEDPKIEIEEEEEQENKNE